MIGGRLIHDCGEVRVVGADCGEVRYIHYLSHLRKGDGKQTERAFTMKIEPKKGCYRCYVIGRFENYTRILQARDHVSHVFIVVLYLYIYRITR
jgi:hypothetical protein